MTLLRSFPVSLLAVLLASCGGERKPPAGITNPSPGAGAASSKQVAMGKAEARKLFDSLCSTCHGKEGHGDGPGAAACDPKPRAFADPAWQDSVDDDHIKKTILLGGAAVGKNPQMPANPQLKSKPETLSALVEIVRGFRKK